MTNKIFFFFFNDLALMIYELFYLTVLLHSIEMVAFKPGKIFRNVRVFPSSRNLPGQGPAVLEVEHLVGIEELPEG